LPRSRTPHEPLVTRTSTAVSCPEMPRPRLRARRPTALLAVALAFCGLTEDAVLCEEAAARLSQCCPGFSPNQLRCEMPTFPVGCAEVDVQTDESRCIMGRTCEDLRGDGTCDRAIAAWTVGFPPADTFPVCR
jgi:hypothetical protein